MAEVGTYLPDYLSEMSVPGGLRLGLKRTRSEDRCGAVYAVVQEFAVVEPRYTCCSLEIRIVGIAAFPIVQVLTPAFAITVK